jgi:hypothetical protein
MNDPEQFRLALHAFAAKAGENAELVVRKTVIDIGASLVMMSPVGNPDLWKDPAPKGYVGGRFRANWQHGYNQVQGGQIDAVDPSGGDTAAQLAASVGSGDAFGVHYIVNNLPYGRRLEYEGWSSQAPAGMVGITTVRFQEFINKAVQEIP